MNENIDLCEILKDCPKGTKFYSPLFGEVTFLRISNDDVSNFCIETLDERKYNRTFTCDGRYDPINKECLLFPSKEQRDWSRWKLPKPKFDPKSLKPYDKVLVRSDNIYNWNCSLFSNIDDQCRDYPCGCLGLYYRFCIPYNEETKHLVGTSDEAPEYYRYWED